DGSSSAEDRASTSEPAREKQGGKRGYPDRDREVQAGQLTAGEWDDLAAWGRFGSLLNSREGDDSKRVWGFRQFHRLEVIVTANGKAVSDASVQLKNGNQAIWKARTNTEGRAYVYAGLYDRSADSQGQYAVQVDSGQESKTIGELQIPQQGSVKVDLGKQAKLS